MAFVAVTFSASIAAILPVLQAIIRPEGVPAWVRQTVAAERLGADIDTFISAEDEPELRLFDRGLLITRLRDKSPLRDSIRSSQLPVLILELNGQRLSSAALCRELAALPDDATPRLTIAPKARLTSPAASQPAARAVPLKKVNLGWRAALWAADRLPAGTAPRERLWTLGYILGGMMCIVLLGNLARFGGEYLIAVVAGRTLISLRRQMYRKVLRLPVAFFAQKGTSDVMSRFVQDSQAIYRGLTYIFVQSIREPLKAIGTFGLALFVNWRITLLAVLGAPLAVLAIRTFGRSIRKQTRRLLQGYGRMLASLEGALTGIRVVKAYGGESYERRHLYETDWHIFKAQARIERIDAATSPMFEAIGYFFGCILTVYFADQVMSNRLDEGEFMLIIVCLASMFDPVRKLSGFYNRISQANAAAERCFEIIDTPDEQQHAAAAALPTLSHSIELCDVTFTYPGAERPSLRNVSLRVARGERVAVVGPNGSGKTTLVSLLMRFFEPDNGEIRFDGIDIRKASLASLRGQIGLVTQDSVIFGDTVRANIAYGRPSLLWKYALKRRHPDRRIALGDSNARIEAAARAAFAADFIEQLPEKYETMIGEHGATLSGGQKQRLAIARAILADAPVLIFDEATSQIDADSEHKIHQALHQFLQNRTAFIIAHRFSTILEADRIVVMDQGRILDTGKHADLLARCGLYKTLFETQLRPA